MDKKAEAFFISFKNRIWCKKIVLGENWLVNYEKNAKIIAVGIVCRLVCNC